MPETVLHVAGLILARGGSQGIPLKNITKLSTHPLLVWSLGAMKAFGRFDSVWVSTDHGLIAACASSMGASVFHRSPRYAKCGTPSVDAVQEFLFNHPEVDIVGLVQCTSPFLQPEFLEKAYNLITEEGYDSVFSVTRDKKLRWSEADFTNDVKEFSETMKSRKSDSSNKKISIIQANQQLPSNTCTQNGAKTTVITTKNAYTMTNGLSKQNSNRDKTTSYSCVPLEASSVSSSNPPSTSTTTKEAVTKQNDNKEVVILSSNNRSRVTMRDSSESLEDAKSSFPNKLIKVEVSPSLRNHSKESRIEAKEAGKEVVVLNGCRNNGHTLEDATNGEEDSDSISPNQDLSCCFSRFENNLSSTSTSTSITTPTSPLSSLNNNKKNPMKPRTKALNFDPVHRPRRQDWKGDLVENGMLYFAKRDLIENEQVLQGGKCSYIEVPTTLSIEIDSSLDLAHAEQTVVHEGLLPFLI